MTARMKPTRAGIIGLWDYTDHTFTFADGRLVLRGANGSGKTKALEVLFPFVLDGRLDPRRLDPFSGENRTMKENLLWGRDGESGYGYAWIEFGDGDRFVTVGVGMVARRHQPSPSPWFFVADGRVGDEVVLVEPDGRPRTRTQLRDALGDGVVVERARDHRARVDAALFGLGVERYEAMLDLVLTLRRPMLAKDLDPMRLSDTLARGLRPLDDDLLEQVARSFDDLEAVQRDLERLVAADDATQSFLTDYRGYLRTQARARADAVIEADAAHRAAADRLARAHAALDQARADEALAEAEAVSANDRLAHGRSRRDALRDSEAFRSTAQLEHLARSVRDLEAAADRAGRAAARADQAVAEAVAGLDRAERTAGEARAAMARLAPRVAQAAGAAGIDWPPDDMPGGVSADGIPGASADTAATTEGVGTAAGEPAAGSIGPDAQPPGAVDDERTLRAHVRARVAARRADLDAVRTRLAAGEDAARGLALAERAAADADEARSRAEVDLGAAESNVADARAQLVADVAAWAPAHDDVVTCDDLAAVRAAVERFGDDGRSPADTWRDRIEPRRHEAIARRSSLQVEASRLDEQRAALDARREAIAAETDDAPPPVPWRGPGRDGRPGAPLWRLVRFADHVSPAAAAGTEAALEAAGLLDAWVHPDGRVDSDDPTVDAFVTLDEQAASAAGPTLASLLVPEAPHDVPVDIVVRLLHAVALDDPPPASPAPADPPKTDEPPASADPPTPACAPTSAVSPTSDESPTSADAPVGSTGGPQSHTSEAGPAPAPAHMAAAVVGADGRYRLGPLTGRHRVDAPRYIGATARAAHRAARLAALDDEIAALVNEAGTVAGHLATVEAWLAAAKAATDALPSVSPLVDARRRRDLAAGRLHAARAQAEAAVATAEAARRELNDRRAALQREAVLRELPTTADGLGAVAAALDRFADDARDLAAALGRAAERAAAAVDAARRHEATAGSAADAARELVERERERDARIVEYDTLRERIGEAAQAVLAELEQVERAIDAGEDEVRRLTESVQVAAARRGGAEGEVGAAGEAVTVARSAADAATARLAVLRRPDLAAPLGLTVPDPAAAAATRNADPTGAAATRNAESADVAAHADAEPAGTTATGAAATTDTDASRTIDAVVAAAGPDADAAAFLAAVDDLVAGTSATDERRKAAQTRVTRGLETLEHALGAGYRPAWDVEDDVIVVTVGDDLGVRSVAAFADSLSGQRADQEVLLHARERALFEDTLLAAVCRQIHERIQSTRDLVAAMDAEMRARRLSSGQTVGVSWRATDASTPEWRTVHRLLDGDPRHFGPDELETIRRHFAAEIAAARAADSDVPYRELLADVLDYRTWRRFELALVEADGTEALLTRARHARLSGGEKAASLHLPLFAAAHAAFAAARAGCPRLLALDEAFAGIDDQGRAELLSLTVAFDLDLFMTGFDLWATHPTVRAVAHHDLLHLPDERAVSSLLVLWNGRELVEGPEADHQLALLHAGSPGA
jgi:hypothetical protein